jgi:hypothetical protein
MEKERTGSFYMIKKPEIESERLSNSGPDIKWVCKT